MSGIRVQTRRVNRTHKQQLIHDLPSKNNMHTFRLIETEHFQFVLYYFVK